MSKKHIELEKIATLLSVAPQAIDFLHSIDDENLEKLRLMVVDTVEMRRDDVWKRVAKVTAFMPNIINAKVAETIVGPSITANLSYHLPIKDVVSIMKHLSVPFMATTAEHMIPEQSKDLLRDLPTDLLKKLVIQLIKVDKHVVISGFVEYTPKYKVVEIVPVLPTPKDALYISQYIADKSLTASIFSALGEQQMKGLVIAAMQENMEEEIISTYPYLNENTMKKMAVYITSDEKLKKLFKLNG